MRWVKLSSTLDVIHREVKQGVEGREAGAEVIQADLDPFRPQFMQGSEGVGTLPESLGVR